MSNGRLNQVLLVGDATARFEVDLVPYGLACVGAQNANDAVAQLKATPFPFVVVAGLLPDMTGPAFVDGLLRHFEPNAVILLGDVDPAQAAQLQRTQKVAIFPANTDGAVIADVLFKRASSASVPPVPTTPAQQSSSGFAAFPGGRGIFGEQRAPTGSGLGVGAAPSLQPPASQASWPPSPSMPQRPAQNGNAFFAAFSAAQGASGAANGTGNGLGAGIASALPPGLSAQLPPQLTQPSSSSMAQALAGMPPVSAPTVDRATLERLEQMATELANANAEVITLRARLAAAEVAAGAAAERVVSAEGRAQRAESEVVQLRAEVDAARRTAMSQVAEVMALSDEGSPIADELDDLKSRADMAESERDSASSQLALVRDERDRLTAELAAVREELAQRVAEIDAGRRQLMALQAALEEAHAAAATAEQKRLQVEAQHKADVDAAALDRENAVAAAVEAARAEAAAAHAADLDAHVEARVAAADGALAHLREELEALRREKADVEAAWAADQERAKELEARVGEAEAAKLDVEHRLNEAAQNKAELEAGLRADLTEALSRYTEMREHAALEEARADRAVADAQAARDEAAAAVAEAQKQKHAQADLQRQLEAALEADGAIEQAKANKAIAETKAVRALLESMTHEQSRLVGENETLRPLAAEVEKARATVVDMQRQLEAALGTDDAEGDTAKAIAEAVRAQTRELHELGRAIEPFTWGLERAIGFFAEKGVDGGAEHVRQLQLLQSILVRMKSNLDKIEG